MKARLPVKVPDRVRRRVEGPAGDDQSGKASSLRSADPVDDQISELLESLEGELERSVPWRARRPPNAPESTPSSPLVRENPTQPRLDREPAAVENGVATLRGTEAPDLDNPWADGRKRSGFLRDPVARERLFFFITALILGIGVGFLVPLLLR
jgi:hypothetical protein